MKIPRLSENRDYWSSTRQQLRHVRVLFDRILGKASCTERSQLRVLELEALSPREKLFILGVRSRPAALNVVDTEVIELLRNHQFVVHRERNGLTLSTVAERRIEGKDFHKLPVLEFINSFEKAVSH